ncbi:MAG TPA: methyltransferase domain-containing protein [Longimicrobiales bacterium]
MACNCGLQEIFTDKVSRHDASKYRRRGLDVRARRMLRALEQRVALRGLRTLEIGIGTGGFTIEMLRRGASRAVGVDAMPNQLEQAKALATEAGVADRLVLKQGDFTELYEEVSPAEVVVLDRVVCCYPDWRSLLDDAAARAELLVVMSYPRSAWYTRIWVKTANLAMRMLRRTFRLYLHAPAEMQALLRQRGWTPQVVGHRVAWELLIATRT